MAQGLNRIATALPVCAAALVFLAAWQFGAILFDLPTYVLPRPLDIIATAFDSVGLFGHAMLVTAAEAIGGFLLGAAIGMIMAVSVTLVPPLAVVLVPLATAINAVPSVAFVPLALIWFGLGIASKIAMAALAVSFIVLLNMMAGLKQADPDAVNLLRSFGSTRFGVLWRLRLPAAMPSLVTGLRVGLARSTIVVIAAEMIGGYSGIGQVIYQSTAQVNYLTVWAAVLVSSLGSLVLYGALVAIDTKLVWWK